jgi:hypothetical protein
MAKSPTAKPAGEAKMRTTIREFNKGSLHSGSKKGPVVKSLAQARAIGLSQARKAIQGKK